MLSYRIKKARLDNGWNQGQLAEALNKSRTAVVNWETGYAKPEDDTVTVIADLLNVDKEWLLDTSNDEFEMMEMESDDLNDHNKEMSKAEKIGARLRYFRKRKSLTGDEVAKYLNVSRTAISYYESGKREPNFDSLVVLSELYEMSIDHLLGISTVQNSPFSIENDDWILEILSAGDDKKLAMKQIWETIRDLHSR